MPTTPRELEFASLFAYSPRGESDAARRSKLLCYELKRGGFTHPRNRDPQAEQPVARWIAERLLERRQKPPFGGFFGADVTLVPMPTHAKRQDDSLWVPMNLCEEFCRAGLAGAISPCIVRTTAVPKAARSDSDKRPTVQQHLDSMSLDRTIEVFDDVLLVDDVVTRGATLMAASIRVLEAFPRARVRAFAVVRTISDDEDLRSIDDPRLGIIKLYESGRTHREP